MELKENLFMPVQILSNGKKIYEFENIADVVALVSLLIHAKIGESIRAQYLLSDVANDLIKVLSIHANESEELAGLGITLSVESVVYSDGGALRQKVLNVIEDAFPGLSAEEAENYTDQGMYPWK